MKKFACMALASCLAVGCVAESSFDRSSYRGIQPGKTKFPDVVQTLGKTFKYNEGVAKRLERENAGGMIFASNNTPKDERSEYLDYVGDDPAKSVRVFIDANEGNRTVLGIMLFDLTKRETFRVISAALGRPNVISVGVDWGYPKFEAIYVDPPTKVVTTFRLAADDGMTLVRKLGQLPEAQALDQIDQVADQLHVKAVKYSWQREANWAPNIETTHRFLFNNDGTALFLGAAQPNVSSAPSPQKAQPAGGVDGTSSTAAGSEHPETAFTQEFRKHSSDYWFVRARAKSRRLQEADQQLNAVFSELNMMLDPGGRRRLEAEERAWVRERDRACGDNPVPSSLDDYADCLAASTKRRTHVLRKNLDDVAE